MRVLAGLVLVGILAGCAGGTDPAPQASGAAGAPPSAAAPTPAATGSATTEPISIVAVSKPTVGREGDDLDYTTAQMTVTVRNNDAAAHIAELVLLLKVTPPGLHGPGWGERESYKLVELTLPPHAEQQVPLEIHGVHTGSRVDVQGSFVRRVDQTVVNDRSLEGREQE